MVGEIVTVRVVGVAPDGNGFAVWKGKPLIVRNGKVGVEYTVRIIRETDTYAVAEIL